MLAGFLLFILILLFFIVVMAALIGILAGSWASFEKAGQEGWKGLIPYYSTYKWLEISNTPRWYWIFIVLPRSLSFLMWASAPTGSAFIVLGTFFHIVFLIFDLLLSINVSKAFGLKPVFALGLVILPFIFLPILGFGTSTYIGSAKRSGK